MSTKPDSPMGYQEIDSRLKKLESGSDRSAFLQFLVYPLILCVIGVIFNRQIENAKDETQRMQIVQSMLTNMFAGNHAQALVSERILAKVTDKKFADDITQLVEEYYVKQMQTAVKNGDLDSAVKILNATQSAGGALNEKITAQVGAATLQTVQGAQLAAEKERTGYEDLLSGNFTKALDDFDASEKAHPGFHHSYEIARLLRQHRNDLDNPAVQKQVIDTIVAQYWGYIPNDTLQKLRQNAKGQASPQ